MGKEYGTVSYYPIAVNIRGKRVVVAGGGKVAQRKVQSLLEAGAHVLVVAPECTSCLSRLVFKGKIKWRKRDVRRADVSGAGIVIAATDTESVNRQVTRWVRATGGWVNVVDRPYSSNFISPAVLRKDKAIVAVYTNGRDPVLSRDLKDFLKESWDDFLSYRRGL